MARMKCSKCQHYKDEVCILAKEGKLAEMENDCLSRITIELLTGILEELQISNDDEREGEWWKDVE